MLVKEELDLSPALMQNYDDYEDDSEYYGAVAQEFVESIEESAYYENLDITHSSIINDDILFTFVINGYEVDFELIQDSLGWGAYLIGKEKKIYLGELPEWKEHRFKFIIKHYLNNNL